MDADMTGTVDWSQLTFLVSLLVVVGGACGLAVWRFNKILEKQRHDLRSHYEQRLVVVEEKFEVRETSLEKRIRQLELFDAALGAVLKKMESFEEKVEDRFDALQRERKQDMQELHRRLDAIMHQQIDKRNADTIRGGRS